MSNRSSKKPMDKKSMTIMWIIIAAVMVYAAANDGEAIIPAVATLSIVTAILAAVAASNKKAAKKGGTTARGSTGAPVREKPGAAAGERSEGQKLRSRRSFWIVMLVLSITALVILPKDLLMSTLRLIQRLGFERAVLALSRNAPGALVGFCIFAGLALVCLIALLRIPALSRRLSREPDNNPVKRRPAQTRVPVHADEREEAVSCDHVRGKEKYIRQLDSYLQAGLIDKNEYRVLKERYNKLEIPEDYH